MANATFRKSVLWLSVSAVTLAAVVGASMAQQPLTKEEIERHKAKQQQKASTAA